MIISIGEKTKDCMKIIGIEAYPFYEDELKSKFRLLIKKYHEDKGGNKQQSQNIIEAYNHLKNLAQQRDEIENNTLKREDNNDLFTEDCPRCKGTGIRYMHEQIAENCIWCYGSGKRTTYCPKCKGTGKFTMKSGNIGICFKCNGTGQKQEECLLCDGTGKRYYFTEKLKPNGHCPICKGTGKVAIERFNPVIRRGAILK